MAALLSECGLVAGHEKVFTENRFNGWSGYEVDVTCWVPHHMDPSSELQLWNGTLVLHQVRNPIDVVNSDGAHWEHLLADIFYPGHRSIYEQEDHKCFPELLKESDPLKKAMAYYVLQNTAIEKLKPFMRYQVEKVDKSLVAHLMLLLGKEVSMDRIETALRKVPKNLNALPEYVCRSLWNYVFNDMPETNYKDLIAEMLGRYGYVWRTRP
jgi:hypothetical protein